MTQNNYGKLVFSSKMSEDNKFFLMHKCVGASKIKNTEIKNN